MTDDLKTRLLAKEGNFSEGDYIFVNPNGPAAVARIEALEAALRQCEVQFRFYETEHLKKKTLDGDAKAYRNAQFADLCRAALDNKQ